MKCHPFVGLRYEILKVVGHENIAMYSFFFMQSMQCLRNKLQETATQVCAGVYTSFSSTHQRKFLHVCGVASTLLRSRLKTRDPINFAPAACQVAMRCCR